MSVCILIPAFNASRTIKELIKKINIYIYKKDIVVVDDGSIDETGKIVEEEGIKLISHKRNCGKGAALKTGFNYVKKNNYDSVITIDADLQHDPSSIPDFIKASKRRPQLDVIIGSRIHDLSRMPFHRRCSNTITSALISIRTRKLIRDSQSGYRLIKRNVLNSVKMRADRYQAESEFLIMTAKKGFHIGTIPIATIYKDEISSIKPLRDTFDFIILYLKSFFW